MYMSDKQTNYFGGTGAVLGGAVAANGYATKEPSYPSETASRQPEVVAEMNRLEQTVEAMAIAMDTLQSRLAPVRQQMGASIGKGDPTPPQSVLCTVASLIRSQREKVEAQLELAHRLLRELEI